ncbi:hypothetical protein MUY27_02975 [Mucilaginibacter sp. RS28]|uniref:Uncharacterized protein n=1 Tax=Mucilaginibacter straminoryzae TaxID=2932774 RepID=A0A9X1X4T9_9SPHI|nr:hypothetical protein [Mucilaginibacter straminoryzae]MCJ8208654.1 hypothetical protein [Mucilaginibacter straminoryzae]
MPFNYANQIFKHGNNVFEYGTITESLVFNFTGLTFGASNHDIFFGFTAPASIVADFGDGNVITYVADYADFASPYSVRFNNDTTHPKWANFKQYTYATGTNSTLRKVTLTISSRNALKEFTCTLPTLQNISLNIGQFKLLQNFGIRCGAATAELKGAFNNALTSLSYQLDQGTTVPIDLCYATIQSLTLYTNANMGNLALIPNIRGLQSLRLDWLNKDAYTTGVPIPPSFANLKITSFGSYFYTGITGVTINIPTTFQSITTLTSLQWSPPMDTWTDLSALTNLTDLNVTSFSLTNHSPDFLLSTNMKLKKITFAQFGAYTNTAAQQLTLINSAIDNMYTWAVANAPIVGTSADKARNQQRIYQSSTSTTAPIPKPTGTYQSPSGYSKGVSNGSPASQLEKLYVLVNQYNWVFTNIPIS